MPASSSRANPTSAIDRDGCTCSESGRSAARNFTMNGRSPATSDSGFSLPPASTAIEGLSGCVPIHISATGTSVRRSPTKCGIASVEPQS